MKGYCDFCKLNDVCGTMVSTFRLVKAGYCGLHNAKQDDYDMILVRIITTPEEQEALDEMIADEIAYIKECEERELAIMEDVLWIMHHC